MNYRVQDQETLARLHHSHETHEPRNRIENAEWGQGNDFL